MKVSIINCKLKNAILEELLDLLKNNIETIINTNNDFIIKIKDNKKQQTKGIIKNLDPQNYIIKILD